MSIECKHILPNGYSQKCIVDLQQDTKTATKVAMVNIWLFAAVLAIGFICVPIRHFIGNWNERGGFLCLLLRIVALMIGYFAYIPLHEFTHAIVMKCLGAKKIQFTISKQFACVGSEHSYFTKKAHLLIALAPLLIWTPVLAVMAYIFPHEWFWVIWLIEAHNIAGSVGDIYISWYLTRFSDVVLINDTVHSTIIFELDEKYSPSNL